MFSSQNRCIYPKNALADVVCQLRFPEILEIGTQAPAAFQESIRQEYPMYRRIMTPVPAAPNSAGAASAEQVHQFSSADDVWKIRLSSGFVSLSCSRYPRWESFAGKLDKPLASFISLYHPAFFHRVGLRYVNIFSRKSMELEEYGFRDLFSPCYLGILSQEDVRESSTTRCSTDCQIALSGGCTARIHAGPGLLQSPVLPDREVKFIFDLDLFMNGQVPVNVTAGAMETLHSQAYPIFRGAISDLLHDRLMESTQ